MWYLYLMIGVAAVCIGVPLFLVYWTDKRKQKVIREKKKSQKVRRYERFGSLLRLADYT